METLQQQFGHVFSDSAFTDRGNRIVGKYGNIEQLDDGTYDCWCVGKDLQPLHGRRLAILEKSLRQFGVCHMLDGEAYIQTTKKQDVPEIGFLLGIRRRKHVSDEQRQKMTERLKRFRAES